MFVHMGRSAAGLQAAIALAHHLGAHVYATAGSETKRAALLAKGVRGAFDSRSLSWADELRAATGGKGVQVRASDRRGAHQPLLHPLGLQATLSHQRENWCR